MAMDASDVAISVVICSSLHVLSVEKFLSSGEHARIEKAINHLQNILNTSKLLESSTNDGQQSYDCRPRLLDHAQHAVVMADKLLLEASGHLKSRKGPLAKIRILVHFMLPRIRTLALDFVTIVEGLSTHLSQMQDLSQHPLNLDKTAALWNAHRGSVRWDGKVESDIVGRENEVNKLLARLIGEDGNSDASSLRVISVVGEEALGKTALVRSVYDRLEIVHSFQCRIWIHVPEEFTTKDLLVEIMTQIPVQELKDLRHKGEDYIKEIIYKSLVELRYLIVFDNLREVKDMDEFMIFLADSSSRSRVIVTTRIPEIPSLIDPWASPVELKELDADGGACLLRECSSIADNPGLKERILSKCSGSPLRILLLGGLVAASGDSSAAMVDQLADNATLSDIVSLSYHKLPSLLKPCLLYLCLFPKESAISIRRLFRLWHAEGWVRASSFTAEECFKELAGRNLVQVVSRRKVGGRPKLCRVPSFLYNILCEMTTQLGLLRIHSNTKRTDHSEKSEVFNGCPLWTDKYEDHQNSGIRLQHLRSYVSFYKKKRRTRWTDMEELFWPLIAKGDCGLLRVLDLEGVYKPRLPDRLGNVLPNLRYLGLRWTALDSIPESVGDMSSLETLDLKYTNVRNLPSSIWEVKSIQHLYMNEVCFDESASHRKPSPKYLSNLQTLWGLYIEVATSPVVDVLSEMTGVEKLGLTGSSLVVKEATKRISELKIIRSLKLRARDLFGRHSDLNLSDMTGLVSLLDLYLLGRMPLLDSLKLLPQNLRILTLSMSRLIHDPMSVLGAFESLEILNLLGGSYTGEELICVSGSFPKLRVLKLWKLEEVKNVHVKVNALRCLEELEIKNCGLLESIHSLDDIKSLKQIRLIKVKEELATEIKRVLTGRVFVKGNKLQTSSSSRQVFIKEESLVTSFLLDRQPKINDEGMDVDHD